ncbi:hypothetical protein Q1695_005959 [Nippostrongylus brasiliensis]|nr:hypothetical protein Q1695_005959 [Nippostrongylus brasiliensis]
MCKTLFRSGRVTQWAGFARIWSPFNTSMMVERFHKRLKYENQGRLCSQIKSISLEIAKKPDACDVLDDVVVNMQQIYQQLAARTEQRAPLNRRFELNTVGPIKKDVPIRLLSRKAAKKAIMIYRHRIESGHHCAPYL